MVEELASGLWVRQEDQGDVRRVFRRFVITSEASIPSTTALAASIARYEGKRAMELDFPLVVVNVVPSEIMLRVPVDALRTKSSPLPESNAMPPGESPTVKFATT